MKKPKLIDQSYYWIISRHGCDPCVAKFNRDCIGQEYWWICGSECDQPALEILGKVREPRKVKESQ